MILDRFELSKRIMQNPPLIENLIDPEVQLQPNGVDLTLREVYVFKSPGRIDFTNKERVLAKTEKLEFDGEWLFLREGVYKAVFNEILNIPKDLCAIARPRSSLLRCGVTVETAVFDAGYRGRPTSLLIVFNPNGIYLRRNARIVQIMFIKLCNPVREGYKGAYLFEGI